MNSSPLQLFRPTGAGRNHDRRSIVWAIARIAAKLSIHNPEVNAIPFLKALPGARRARHGFTLVEVVLALAVASFGLISMMGLLTVGLKTVRDAITTTTEAEISQQLSNQLQMSSYASLVASGQTTYYFTQEGLPTTLSQAVYTAVINPPRKLTAPGGDINAPVSVLTFVISISLSKSPNLPANAIPVHIANNGS